MSGGLGLFGLAGRVTGHGGQYLDGQYWIGSRTGRHMEPESEPTWRRILDVMIEVV